MYLDHGIDSTRCAQGTGTGVEMKLEERTKLATEGLVVAAVAVDRRSSRGSKKADTQDSDSDSPLQFKRLHGAVKLSSRALWLGNGQLIPQLHHVIPSPPSFPLHDPYLAQTWRTLPHKVDEPLSDGES